MMGLAWWRRHSVKSPESFFLFFRPLRFAQRKYAESEYNFVKEKIQNDNFPSPALLSTLDELTDAKKDEMIVSLHSLLEQSIASGLNLPDQKDLVPQALMELCQRITQLEPQQKNKV